MTKKLKKLQISMNLQRNKNITVKNNKKYHKKKINFWYEQFWINPMHQMQRISDIKMEKKNQTKNQIINNMRHTKRAKKKKQKNELIQ